MDENSISVPCAIEGCNARVYGAVRCHEHGGEPIYEWRHDDFGVTSYRIRQKGEFVDTEHHRRG